MKRLRYHVAAVLLSFAVAVPHAAAWGKRGHEIIALIAWRFMTPATQQQVERLLAHDDSGLTGRDIAAEATWADVYRDSDRNGSRQRYRETFRWHFVNLDLAHPDFDRACAAHDCVVDQIERFERTLRDPHAGAHERVRALQFLLHLIGDVHQPLHASNRDDDGGNRVHVIVGANKRNSLHGYWDNVIVRRLGRDPEKVGARLAAQISAGQRARWQRGDAHAWALESWRLARDDIYGDLPAPLPDGSYRLDGDYQAHAADIARRQLQRAGVRLAFTLNEAFAQPSR